MRALSAKARNASFCRRTTQPARPSPPTAAASLSPSSAISLNLHKSSTLGFKRGPISPFQSLPAPPAYFTNIHCDRIIFLLPVMASEIRGKRFGRIAEDRAAETYPYAWIGNFYFHHSNCSLHSNFFLKKKKIKLLLAPVSFSLFPFPAPMPPFFLAPSPIPFFDPVSSLSIPSIAPHPSLPLALAPPSTISSLPWHAVVLGRGGDDVAGGARVEGRDGEQCQKGDRSGRRCQEGERRGGGYRGGKRTRQGRVGAVPGRGKERGGIGAQKGRGEERRRIMRIV